MKSRKCEICESPSAKSIHFGARACKACAAFFRRTVALNVVYKCKESAPCAIHYEKRMTCKKCRYDKCMAATMNRELVKSTRGTERSSRTVRENSIRNGDHSMAPECDYRFEQIFTLSPSISQVSTGAQKEDRRQVIEYYKRTETVLNNRRRIMYTDTRMINVFNTSCECLSKKLIPGRRLYVVNLTCRCRQRTLLIRCLNDLAVERSHNPEERMGSIILFISCVFQQMLELVNSLVMIMFFNIFDCDHVLKDFFRSDSF